MKKYQILLIAFLILCGFVLSFVGGAIAQDLAITSNTTWEPGTYSYDNITVTNSATLTLNGQVILNAQSLTIDSGASISSDAKGYPTASGPGAGAFNGQYGAGAGFGGKGGDAWDIGSGQSGAGGSFYGSALTPIDLGSGGGYYYGGAGGGAIKLAISGSLTLNGKITANGADGGAASGGGGSGGSIYITTLNLSGSGTILANGGIGGNSSGGGSGGRIAVYYKTSSFTNSPEAKGGTGNQTGENGTIAFIDTQNNILYTGHSFRFQENDSPFNFNKVILNNSQVTTQGNTSLTADQLLLENSSLSLAGASLVKANTLSLQNNSKLTLNDTSNLTASNASTITNSSLTFTGAQALSIPSLTLDNSSLTLSGKETLSLTSLTLNNNSTLTHSTQGNIDLSLSNLTLDATSSISLDAKGYPSEKGPGAGMVDLHRGSGAGYGGKGADMTPGTGGSFYGSSLSPTDLGSGGGTSWYNLGGSGGGAVKLTISDSFVFNGKITTNGEDGKVITTYQTISGGGGSGGSVYIIANTLSGSGLITANGGKGGGWEETPWYGGGGGGGRIAVYYKTLSFAGRTEAKGGAPGGQDGTIVFQPISLDTPLTSFNLIEKSSTTATSQETLSTQQFSLNNIQITGDLTGTLNFTSLELTTLTSGAFSGKGFLEGEFQTTLEGISYQGTLKGAIYPDPKENKLHLKASISGLLINGIAEATLTESTPGSGTYDKYQSTWKLNRLATDTLSATLNLEGTVSNQSSHSFTSSLYIYQANYEGDALGSYSGPLSAVLTHLRLTGENEYKGKGFSIISYNSLLGQGEGYSYNQILAEGIIDFQGLFQSPLLGRVTATLDETRTPKTLSGTIERLDLGETPSPDLKVNVWGPTRVSPGQTVNSLIELRNDGLKEAKDVSLLVQLPVFCDYLTSSNDSIHYSVLNMLRWNISSIPAKSTKQLYFQVRMEWGIAEGTGLSTGVFLIPKDKADLRFEFFER